MQVLRYFGILFLFYSAQAGFFAFFINGLSLFTPENLLNWDAEHYGFIATEGYDIMRTAFFPLFPVLWNITNLSVPAVSILNGLLFIVSFSFIASMYQIRWHHLILIAATPTFVFFFLPYSESLFFLGSILILIGYRRPHFALLLIGFFITSLARPTAGIFLPALIITEWLCRKNAVTAMQRIIASTVVVLVGMFAALYFQQLHTGTWLTFFEVQAEHWDNRLRIPEFPLRSWAGMWVTALDGTALFISLCSGYQLFKWWVKARFKLQLSQEKSLVFSLLYLFGSGLVVLLFRGGELFSVNRFIFASAFFIVAANYFLRQQFTRKHLAIPGLMFLYWLLFNSFVHIQTLLKYAAVTLFNSLAVLSVLKNPKITRAAMLVFFIGLVVLQVYFYQRFLAGGWIA